MKKAKIAFCLLILFSGLQAEAQPPPPPGWHGGDNNESPLQEEGFLGNGLGLLTIMGLVYGAVSLRRQGSRAEIKLHKNDP